MENLIDVSGVRLTPEWVAWLNESMSVWEQMPVDNWVVPALVCKAVYDALPVSDE